MPLTRGTATPARLRAALPPPEQSRCLLLLLPRRGRSRGGSLSRRSCSLAAREVAREHVEHPRGDVLTGRQCGDAWQRPEMAHQEGRVRAQRPRVDEPAAALQ